MNFWITGISRVLRILEGGDQVPVEVSQVAIDLEITKGRLQQLERENASFRASLAIVSREFGMNMDELIKEAESGSRLSMRDRSPQSPRDKAPSPPLTSKALSTAQPADVEPQTVVPVLKPEVPPTGGLGTYSGQLSVESKRTLDENPPALKGKEAREEPESLSRSEVTRDLIVSESLEQPPRELTFLEAAKVKAMAAKQKIEDLKGSAGVANLLGAVTAAEPASKESFDHERYHETKDYFRKALLRIEENFPRSLEVSLEAHTDALARLQQEEKDANPTNKVGQFLAKTRQSLEKWGRRMQVYQAKEQRDPKLMEYGLEHFLERFLRSVSCPIPQCLSDRPQGQSRSPKSTSIP